MAEDKDARRLRELTSAPTQAWLTAVSVTVTTHDFDALVQLGSSRDALLLTGSVRGDEEWDEFSVLKPSPIGRSANAILDVAHAVLDPAARAAAIAAAVAAFDASGVSSATRRGSVQKDPIGRIAPLVRSLRASASRSAPFAELLALLLMDEFPKEQSDAVIVPVLLDPSVGTMGVAAHLRIVLLRDGPPGLHPDPRRMSFVRYDDSFADALGTAWELSPLAATDACAVWTLSDGDDAVLNIRGASLGAALAVALDELAPRTRWGRLLRRRSLNSACAVTAQLTAQGLRAVGGYEPKLRAAARRGWRVIIPAESVSAVEDAVLKLELNVEVSAAGTVNEAIRLSRSRINRKFVVALVVSAMLLLGGGGGAAFAAGMMRTSVQEEAERRAAVELAARSGDMLSVNPRLAAFMALASYELDPGVTTAAALLRISEEYSFLQRAVSAHSTTITKIAAAGDLTLTASEDGSIASWSDELTLLDRIELDSPTHHLATSPDGSSTAVVAGNELIVLSVEGNGKLTTISRASALAADSAIARPLALVFTHSSNAIHAVFSSGAIRRYGLDGHVVAERSLSDAVEITTRTGQTPHLVAATTDAPSAAGGDRLLLVSNGGDVYRWEDVSAEAEIVVPRAILPAAATSVRTVPFGGILVGTERGAVLCYEEGPENMRCGGEVLGVTEDVIEMALSEDGRVLIRHGSAFRHRTVSFGNIYGAGGAVESMAGTALSFTAQGALIGTEDGRLLVLGDPGEDASLPSAPGSTVIGFTPEGRLIRTQVVGSSNNVSAVQVLELSPDGTRPIVEEYTLPSDWGYSTWYVNDVEATEDLIVAAGLSPSGRTGQILGWDRRTGQMLFSLQPEGDPASGVDPIINRARILEGGDKLVAFNVSSGLLTTWSLTDRVSVLGMRALGGGMASLEHAPESDTLYALTWPERETGRADHEVVAIDVASGAILWRVDAGRATRLSLNTVDGRMALLDGSRIEVLSPDGSERVATVDLDEPAVDLAWDPEGKRLAALSSLGRVHVLDGTSLSAAVPPLSTDPETPFSFGWSADGSLLAVTTPRMVDGRLHVGPVLLYQPDPHAWVERVCRITGAPFSEQEWISVIGDEIPYRKLCPT